MSHFHSGSRRGSKTNTSKAMGDLLLILSSEHAAAFRSNPKNDKQVIFGRRNCPKGTREIIVRGSKLADIEAWCQQPDSAVAHTLWLKPDQVNGYIKTESAKKVERPGLPKRYSSVPSLDEALADLEGDPNVRLKNKYGTSPPATRRSSSASAKSLANSASGSQTQQRRTSFSQQPGESKMLKQQQEGKKLSARQLKRLKRMNGYNPSWLLSSSDDK